MKKHLLPPAIATLVLVAAASASAQGLKAKPRPDQAAPPPVTGPDTGVRPTEREKADGEGEKTEEGRSGALQISADHQEQTGTGTWAFDGNVRIVYKELEVQADRVEVDKERGTVAAEGNVLIVSGKMRLSGERAELDLESKTGTIYEGYALIDPTLQVKGARIDKVGDDRFILYEGEITACDQAIPQWSLKASTAKLTIDGYAQVWNARFTVKRAPIFYTPYLIWPVKQDRSTGFLLPHLGASKSRGTLISEAFFLVLGRSADATLYADWYSDAGLGPSLQVRWAPAENARGEVYGFYLKDKRTDEESWRYAANHQQPLGERFRFVVDANVVSDASYYQEFERNFSNFSSRVSRWTTYVTGTLSDFSLNLRAEDSDEFRSRTFLDEDDEVVTISDTVETSRLPEASIVRREAQLFGPVFLAFDVTAGLYERRVVRTDEDAAEGEPKEETTYDADYSRVDVYPRISFDIPSLPWLSIRPTVSGRYTHWSQSLALQEDPPIGTLGTLDSEIVDEPITRTYGEAALDLVGPSIARIWESDPDEDGKTRKKKHLIEPKVSYHFVSDFDEYNRVPVVDGTDFVLPLHELSYGLVSRYFVKRPAIEDPDPLDPPTDYHYVYDSACGCYQKRPKDASQGAGGSIGPLGVQVFEAPADATEQVKELWNFSVTQKYSLDADLATDYGRRYTYNGGLYVPPEARERFSPVIFQFNYYPTRYSSVTATVDYDAQSTATAYDTEGSGLVRVLLSAALRDRKGRWLELSYSDNTDVAQRQLRTSIGYSLAQDRWRFEADTAYDLENGLGDTGLRYGRALVNWNGQCWGIIAEYSAYSYTGFDDYEFRVALTLPQVGTFLDLRRGASGLYQGNRFGGSRGAPF